MIQEIDQQLLNSKHTFTLGQLMHLAPNLNGMCFLEYLPIANQPIFKLHLLM
jgi:hypothetical protein